MSEFRRFTTEEMKLMSSRTQQTDELIEGRQTRRGGHGGSRPGEKVGGGAEYVVDKGVKEPRLHVTGDQLASARREMSHAEAQKIYSFADYNAAVILEKQSLGKDISEREQEYLAELKKLGDRYRELKALKDDKKIDTETFSNETYDVNKRYLKLSSSFDADEADTELAA